MRRRLAVALSVCALAAFAEPPELHLSAHVVVTGVPEEFGGLSGLIMSENGGRAQVLSDRAKIFEVGFWRDDAQTLERVAVLRAKYLLIYEPQHRIDSEGLARAPDGGLYVSTENPPAVLHYERDRHWPDHMADLPELLIRNTNRGLEALAVDPEGRLVTIPEVRPRDEPGFPVYRLEDGAWQRVGVLAQEGPFLVVGADYGPDGRLYLLERAVSVLGFRTRIRRVALADGDVQAETLFQSRLGQFDNLEGISLWRDKAGELRIMLVSDSNFFAVQRTEFVEFILRE